MIIYLLYSIIMLLFIIGVLVSFYIIFLLNKYEHDLYNKVFGQSRKEKYSLISAYNFMILSLNINNQWISIKKREIVILLKIYRIIFLFALTFGCYAFWDAIMSVFANLRNL